MNTLVHIPYSPWSLRARWALDFHGVAYDQVVFDPVWTTPWVRWKLRKPTGRLTFPVLLRPEQPALCDSTDIAEHAAHGADTPLLTPENRVACDAWVARAERLMGNGRILTTQRVVADPETLRENLPGFLRPLGPIGLAVGRKAAGDLHRKYGHLAEEQPRDVMTEELTHLRQALDGRDTLLPTFSWADIVMATALSFIEPLAEDRVPLGARSRACWTEPELATSFADLLLWRDQLINTYWPNPSWRPPA